MWLVAGLLLGGVGLSFLTSFHTQLHGHIATSVLGVFAAAWLIAMAARGYGSSLVWTLFGLDISLSVGTATLAYKGFFSPAAQIRSTMPRLVGATGVTLTELAPRGSVRVNGEVWSAESLSGEIPVGSEIQVASVKGIHLEVMNVIGGQLPHGFFELDPELVEQRPALNEDLGTQ
jgi:membrane-bound ClpP family serine protease